MIDILEREDFRRALQLALDSLNKYLSFIKWVEIIGT